MDRGMVIVVGALLTFSSSWLGIILIPYWQMRSEQPFADAKTQSEPYPHPTKGKALQGRKVYIANGCIYCHSQQVRSETFGNWWEDSQMKTGADIRRGWGSRRTVSRDYIYDDPPLLGTMRTGPDLSSVGTRFSEEWQLRHGYNPRAVNEWSIMPAFPFLYRREKVVGERSALALQLGREWTIKPGYRWRPDAAEWQRIVADSGERMKRQLGISADLETPAGQEALLQFWLTTPEDEYQVVPTREGEALAAYLIGLNKTEVPLPEAKE